MITFNFRSTFLANILLLVFLTFDFSADAASVLNDAAGQPGSQTGSTSRWITSTTRRSIETQMLALSSIAGASSSNFSSTIQPSTTGTPTLPPSSGSILNPSQSGPQSSSMPTIQNATISPSDLSDAISAAAATTVGTNDTSSNDASQGDHQSTSDPNASLPPTPSSPSAPPADPSIGKEIVGGLMQSLVPGLLGSNAAAAGNKLGALGLLPTISKLSTPLAHIITNNGTPSTSDVEQLIKAVPDIAVSLGVLGAAANVAHKSLNGGLGNAGAVASTPALPANFSAWTPEQINDLVSGKMPLPPLHTLPQEYVSTVLSGGSLPGLTQDQTDAVKNRYMQSMIGGDGGLGDLFGGASIGEVAKGVQDSAAAAAAPLIGNIFANITQTQTINLSKISAMTPNLINELSKLDLSQLPTDVIQSFLKGETPDLSRIPPEFMQKLINSPQIFGELVNSELQKKIQNDTDFLAADQPKNTDKRPSRNGPNPIPYDVNSLDKKADISMYRQHEDDEQAVVWIAVVLGVVGLIAILVIAYLCYRCRRNKKLINASLTSGNHNGPTLIIEDHLENPTTPTITSTSFMAPHHYGSKLSSDTTMKSNIIDETDREIRENRVNAEISRNFNTATVTKKNLHQNSNARWNFTPNNRPLTDSGLSQI